MLWKTSIKYLILQFLLLGSIFHKVYPIVIACLMKITNGFQIRDEDVIGYKKVQNSVKYFSISSLIQHLFCMKKKKQILKIL